MLQGEVQGENRREHRNSDMTPNSISVVEFGSKIARGITHRKSGGFLWVETRLESRLEITPGKSGRFLVRNTRSKSGLGIALADHPQGIGWFPVAEGHVENRPDKSPPSIISRMFLRQVLFNVVCRRDLSPTNCLSTSSAGIRPLSRKLPTWGGLNPCSGRMCLSTNF